MAVLIHEAFPDEAANGVVLTVPGEGGVDVEQVRAAAEAGVAQGALPDITDEALDGLKFSAALPRDIAASVIAERMTDPAAAAEVCQAAIRTSLSWS